MKTEDRYYNDQKRSEVMETARRLRRKYLRYQQAEIVYSLSHKKLMELASDAEAIYRLDGIVLINREISMSILKNSMRKKRADGGLYYGICEKRCRRDKKIP